jgi:homoprotocatechuate degradation regulator HpaR
MALLRARESVMAHFRPLLARHGVTEQQWRVIRVLGESGPLDATELSARCAILMPSLTRMIRDLAARELVSKRRDARDGRRLILDVTPRAGGMIAGMLPEINAAYQAIEAEFGKERLERLLDALEALGDGKP